MTRESAFVARVAGVACICLLALAADVQAQGALGGLSAAEMFHFAEGQLQFERVWTESEGLGPRFNASGCADCHRNPATGGSGATYQANTRLGQNAEDPPSAELLRSLAVAGLPPVEIAADMRLSDRRVPALFGLGLVEAIPEGQILAVRDDQLRGADGISGRNPWDSLGRFRRFGSQSQAASIRQLVEDALGNELGLDASEAGQPAIDDIVDFLRRLAPPPRGYVNEPIQEGEQLFSEIGCGDCHTQSFYIPARPYVTEDGERVDLAALQGVTIRPYSDFLLHDLGPSLDDGVRVRSARTNEYRTTPLWGFRYRPVDHLLHDGRASSPSRAIRLHGGEASESRRRFGELTFVERRRLLAFLGSI